MAYTRECPNCHTNADNFDDEQEFEQHVEHCNVRDSRKPRRKRNSDD